jgi:hypothetical protein
MAWVGSLLWLLSISRPVYNGPSNNLGSRVAEIMGYRAAKSYKRSGHVLPRSYQELARDESSYCSLVSQFGPYFHRFHLNTDPRLTNEAGQPLLLISAGPVTHQAERPVGRFAAFFDETELQKVHMSWLPEPEVMALFNTIGIYPPQGSEWDMRRTRAHYPPDASQRIAGAFDDPNGGLAGLIFPDPPLWYARWPDQVGLTLGTFALVWIGWRRMKARALLDDESAD